MRQLKTIVAHRGASGYLPEHTLPAVAMAHAMGADYLEADIVLTKDGIPMVLHDIFLEPTTNVAQLFPNRSRKDGHWYAIDFTLSQIKTLSVHERTDKTGKPIYPNRFPLYKSHLEIPTFSEWIELIQGLNKSTGKTVGIYPELKAPAFHEQSGFRFGQIVFSILESYGYKKKTGPIFVQCFDPDYLQGCRQSLKSELPFIQLIAPNEWRESKADYDLLQTKAGLKTIATYAQGVGIWMDQVNTNPLIVQTAHEQGLLVHVYTLRSDELPSYAANFNALLELFFDTFQVDGVFTDFPDKVSRFLA